MKKYKFVIYFSINSKPKMMYGWFTSKESAAAYIAKAHPNFENVRIKYYIPKAK